jgi:hypothetical protein
MDTLKQGFGGEARLKDSVTLPINLVFIFLHVSKHLHSAV